MKIECLKDLRDVASKSASDDIIYSAHKSLMELNDKNQKIFCDVVQFLEHKKEDVL